MYQRNTEPRGYLYRETSFKVFAITTLPMKVLPARLGRSLSFNGDGDVIGEEVTEHKRVIYSGEEESRDCKGRDE